MSTSSKAIGAVLIAALIAALAAVGSAARPALFTSATADVTAGGVSPSRSCAMPTCQRLPVHEIRDGECAERAAASRLAGPARSIN